MNPLQDPKLLLLVAPICVTGLCSAVTRRIQHPFRGRAARQQNAVHQRYSPCLSEAREKGQPIRIWLGWEEYGERTWPTSVPGPAGATT